MLVTSYKSINYKLIHSEIQYWNELDNSTF